MSTEEFSKSGLLNLLISILLVITTALSGWNLRTTQQNQVQLATINERTKNLNVGELQSDVEDLTERTKRLEDFTINMSRRLTNVEQ